MPEKFATIIGLRKEKRLLECELQGVGPRLKAKLQTKDMTSEVPLRVGGGTIRGAAAEPRALLLDSGFGPRLRGEKENGTMDGVKIELAHCGKRGLIP